MSQTAFDPLAPRGLAPGRAPHTEAVAQEQKLYSRNLSIIANLDRKVQLPRKTIAGRAVFGQIGARKTMVPSGFPHR